MNFLVRLHVDHAKESDSGIVSCQAVNNEGTAEAQAILTVRKMDL